MYFLYFIEQDKYIYYIRALARNGKKFCVLHKLGKKQNWGSEGNCRPLSGFSGEQGTKDLGEFTILILKLVCIVF